MSYTRIEHEAGGAARLAMPALNAGAIDKVTDARANILSRREDNEGLNRLCPSPKTRRNAKKMRARLHICKKMCIFAAEIGEYGFFPR